MEEYILTENDSARVLGGEMIELFCDRRTMIFFAIAALSCVQTVTDVPAETGAQEALRFVGEDSLLGKRYAVLVPQGHRDHAALRAALRETDGKAAYVKAACNHDGRGARH